MSDRMNNEAKKIREAANTVRARGNDDKAARMEARATELESGRVTDVTDQVIGLFRLARRR
ncbi:hypothetical protein ACWEP4_42975 [Streptomyces sp. NPDC004227]